MKGWDLVVVGAGPSGLAAGVVAHGNRLHTCVLEAGAKLGGQVHRADAQVVDLLGRPAPSGRALAVAFQEHVERVGLRVRFDSPVQSIVCEPAGVVLRVGDELIRSRFVLLATGLSPRRLGVPGETEFSGAPAVRRRVTSSAGRSVVIVGGGDEGADLARRFGQAGARVTVVVRTVLRARRLFRDALADAPGVTVKVGLEVVAFEGEDRLEQVRLSSGERIRADEAYVRIGGDPYLPDTEPSLAQHADGRVQVDECFQTSCDRIYAAGDLVRLPAARYIAVAAADGTIAAREIERRLDRELAGQGLSG